VTATVDGLRQAYERSVDAWATGPARVYDRLAEVLVAHAPGSLAGRLVADVGAGRGAASRALRAAGALPLAIDLSEGMVRAERGRLRLAADARALPLGDAAVDGVVAAFSFNHVPDPTTALAEAARVTRPGGVVLASAYAADDDHPVKRAVDAAALALGWEPDPWVDRIRTDAAPHLATPEGAAQAARAAGLDGTRTASVEVPFPELGAAELVAWRLGMAAIAPWVQSMTDQQRDRLTADALERLGDDSPVLVRRIVVLVTTVNP
jgi:SAM-dependent methyltransferase